jgi:hypothetical protein
MVDHEDYVPAPLNSIPNQGCVIEFPYSNKRDAGDLAKDLKLSLDNAMGDAGLPADSHTLRLGKADPKAQDPGTIIAVILTAKATAAIAAGIALWMRRRNQSRIRGRFENGTCIDITSAESKHIEGILKAATNSVINKQ